MRLHFAFGLILSLASLAIAAEDVGYRKCKLADVKGKQANADLIFSDAKKSMIVNVAGDHTIASIPYETIDKLSYEFSKHHRIKQGAVVMVASLGAGAIVMLTSSKNHWLTIEYHEGSVPKTLVLKMDKSEYRDILSAAKTATGKEVEFVQDAAMVKAKKEKAH